jgi:hypothetical protein
MREQGERQVRVASAAATASSRAAQAIHRQLIRGSICGQGEGHLYGHYHPQPSRCRDRRRDMRAAEELVEMHPGAALIVELGDGA